jgi:hypothetical protein
MNTRIEKDDPLIGTEFADLPEAFTPRNPQTGRIDGDPVTAPVWFITEDTARGKHRNLTLYTEGSEIIDHETPNRAMRPLNRAAARRCVAWRESLPLDGAVIAIDDLLEAATKLAGDGKFEALSKEDKAKVIGKLAAQTKKRRSEDGIMELPPISNNFGRPAYRDAEPMVGVKYSQVMRDSPGVHRQNPPPLSTGR